MAPCSTCGGSGLTRDRLPCGRCTVAANATNAPAPKRRSIPGQKIWATSDVLMGWMGRLPRWILWPFCALSGVLCALWMAQQPEVLPGVVALTGFIGLFVPMLAYIALRYAVGLSIRLTLGALPLAVGLAVGYFALVAAGLIPPLGQ